MDDRVIQRLLMLNAQFYQTFARPFSQSRQRLQPGVLRVLHDHLLKLPHTARILDLGCGNGEFAHILFQSGFIGKYSGIDFNPEFLDEAQQKNHANNQDCEFLQADLGSNSWRLNLYEAQFQAIVSFATLHHIPAAAHRLSLLNKCCDFLTNGGLMIVSVWQFSNSPRLISRIVPCEKAGFDPAELEPGDTFMDWRQDGYGLRYVHHFTEEELTELMLLSGFSLRSSFYSDGREGNLALYQVWEKEPR